MLLAVVGAQFLTLQTRTKTVSRNIRAQGDDPEDFITNLRVSFNDMGEGTVPCRDKINRIGQYELIDVSDENCYSYESGQPLVIRWDAPKDTQDDEKFSLYWATYNTEKSSPPTTIIINGSVSVKSQRYSARLPDMAPIDTMVIPIARRYGSVRYLYAGSPTLLVWPKASGAAFLSDARPYHSVYIFVALLTVLVVAAAIFLFSRNAYVKSKLANRAPHARPPAHRNYSASKPVTYNTPP